MSVLPVIFVRHGSPMMALETVHDCHGFPEPFYRLRYPAPRAWDGGGRLLHGRFDIGGLEMSANAFGGG